MIFIDLAGMLDSRGVKFDLVQAMMIGMLIKNLKSFRILHVLSRGGMIENRGDTYKKGLYMINEILSGNLYDHADSI